MPRQKRAIEAARARMNQRLVVILGVLSLETNREVTVCNAQPDEMRRIIQALAEESELYSLSFIDVPLDAKEGGLR